MTNSELTKMLSYLNDWKPTTWNMH